jgi:hypothetical protein
MDLAAMSLYDTEDAMSYMDDSMKQNMPEGDIGSAILRQAREDIVVPNDSTPLP